MVRGTLGQFTPSMALLSGNAAVPSHSARTVRLQSTALFRWVVSIDAGRFFRRHQPVPRHRAEFFPAAAFADCRSRRRRCVSTTTRSPAGITWRPKPRIVVPDLRLRRPAPPLLPPALPRAAYTMRSNVAEMIIGASSPLAISMIWPRPPRCSPAPPESGRYSFFQYTTGDSVSMISTATLRIPLGNEVTDKPSLPGPRARAAGVEADDVEAGLRLCSCSGSTPLNVWPPASRTFHSDDVPSAGTRSGRACCRQPNTTSGSIWPMVERAATASGNGALTIAAFRRRHAHDGQRARVVRNVAADDAAHAERRVRVGIGFGTLMPLVTQGWCR